MSESNSSGGIGVFGLLGVLFIGLKLTGFIDWSWWWVLTPFWGGLVLVLLIIAVVIIIKVIAAYYDDYRWRRRFNRRK